MNTGRFVLDQLISQSQTGIFSMSHALARHSLLICSTLSSKHDSDASPLSSSVIFLREDKDVTWSVFQRPRTMVSNVFVPMNDTERILFFVQKQKNADLLSPRFIGLKARIITEGRDFEWKLLAPSLRSKQKVDADRAFCILMTVCQ